MNQTTQLKGCTFSVDDVHPAAKPLPEVRIHEAVKFLLGGDIESCSHYHGSVIEEVRYQPLLAAVHTAFSQHRPLVLGPDAVWLTIAQGVAHHMAIHGERLRSRFVGHEGKKDLVFTCSDWVEGSPENPWQEAFASWAAQIRDYVGAETNDLLVCDFSTTGPIETAASQIVMMDVFERYFHYVAYCICGIPTVTLEGTPADWSRLTSKVRALERFDLDWWLDHLLPICQEFERARSGQINMWHWANICKLREEYGGNVINGWIAKLFPYLREFINGPCTRRNPIFETGEGFQSLVAPSGLSKVPFTWRNAMTGRQRPMEAIGGLVGVAQNLETLALTPKVGWAVRPAEKMDVALARLAAEHRTFPGSASDAGKDDSLLELRAVPPDLARFYHDTDGAEILGPECRVVCRILPRKSVKRLHWGKVREELQNNDTPNGHIWYRLARLADGNWLAMNPRPAFPEWVSEQYRRDPGSKRWDSFVAVCRCEAGTQGKPGKNPVVALSFTELLERLLDQQGQPYWQSPRFVSYGDAEEYTRRV